MTLQHASRLGDVGAALSEAADEIATFLSTPSELRHHVRNEAAPAGHHGLCTRLPPGNAPRGQTPASWENDPFRSHHNKTSRPGSDVRLRFSRIFGCFIVFPGVLKLEGLVLLKQRLPDCAEVDSVPAEAPRRRPRCLRLSARVQLEKSAPKSFICPVSRSRPSTGSPG